MTTSVTSSGATPIAFSPSADRARDPAAALVGHRLVEAGVHHPRAARSPRPPRRSRRAAAGCRAGRRRCSSRAPCDRGGRSGPRSTSCTSLHHPELAPAGLGPSQMTIAAMPRQHHRRAHRVDQREALILQQAEHVRHHRADRRGGVIAEARADAAHFGGELLVAVGRRHAPDAHAEEAHHQRAEPEQRSRSGVQVERQRRDRRAAP